MENDNSLGSIYQKRMFLTYKCEIAFPTKRYDSFFCEILNSKLILDFDFKNKSGEVVARSCFLPIYNLSNNYILVFVNGAEPGQYRFFVEKSPTQYPPIWNREFSSGPDYFDYISVGNVIKSQFDVDVVVDESYTGKSVNFTKEPSEEVERLIKEGKSYSIISVLAESVLKKIQ